GSVERPPGAAIARLQFVGRSGTAAACGVIREITRRIVCPSVEDRLRDLPAGFDGVGALKQRRIADHAVVDQRLVSGVAGDLEVGLVCEIHVSPCSASRWDPDTWPRTRARYLHPAGCEGSSSWDASAPHWCRETAHTAPDESGSRFRSIDVSYICRCAGRTA